MVRGSVHRIRCFLGVRASLLRVLGRRLLGDPEVLSLRLSRLLVVRSIILLLFRLGNKILYRVGTGEGNLLLACLHLSVRLLTTLNRSTELMAFRFLFRLLLLALPVKLA